ncbi:hypothetical protein GIB67_008826, partial [Kingdonia uniflora]
REALMATNETLKNRKRNKKLYGFHTFGDPGCPIDHLSGPFRDNIREFLRECGEIEDYNVEGMPTWCTHLVNESNGVVVPLYTVEENVKHSSRPFCDHCRCAGWSHHFVSKRRYHLIIPSDGEWDDQTEGSVYDFHSHLLHGLIHCNGYGHLLCINGLEGGSEFLCGREIMDLWDRLCTTLRTRKITVEDSSVKRSMDLRLLYGVAYGHSWFGRWGYKFYHGSFGVTEHNYEAAIRVLSSLNIGNVLEDLGRESRDKLVKEIVQVYREMSDTQLTTIRDLIRFMLTVKSRAPVQRKVVTKPPPPAKAIKPRKSLKKNNNPTKYKKFKSFVSEMDSRWPKRRLEYAAEVIVEALKERQGGMSRQEVRDAARLHIGDTGLLDFVIKSINNYIVGNYVVLRTLNPSTRVLEFTINEVNSPTIVDSDEDEAIVESPPITDPVGLDVYQDAKCLYHEVLEEYPESELVELATRVVLDSKHLVKEWIFKDDEEDVLLRFLCQLLMTPDECEMKKGNRPLPQGELVVVPPYATVGDLKIACEEALKDTYCIMKGLTVDEIEGVDVMNDEEVLFGSFESGANVWVRGSGMDLESKLTYEGGSDSWTVDCSCGAKDDDGERMVSCDICEVWQHTRCNCIDENEVVPTLFLCSRCCSSIMPALGDYKMDMEYY